MLFITFKPTLLTGNLGRVDYITEIEYDIFIRPDTCNPRFRVWFYFTVTNVRADQVSLGVTYMITYAAHMHYIRSTYAVHTQHIHSTYAAHTQHIHSIYAAHIYAA